MEESLRELSEQPWGRGVGWITEVRGNPATAPSEVPWTAQSFTATGMGWECNTMLICNHVTPRASGLQPCVS